ncbi:hypothetical protein GF337_02560 [candidate division KSB1 bacterium]|nr:hypothetical protein [candidate division KSB1 bacterium]
MKSHIIKIALLSALVIALMTGCSEDNPVEADHEHNEAEGVLLKIDDTIIVRVEEGEVKEGKITVKVNEETSSIFASFLDHDGEEFIPDEEGSYLLPEIADESIATAEVVTGQEWHFTVSGVKAGTTTLIVKLMHGDHHDFLTPAIQVEVTE